MTIHFNPYFNEGAYVDLVSRGGVLFGAKVAGPMGLLSELEERLGLAGVYPGEVERTVLYVRAMREAQKQTPSFLFRESFANDEIGTARTLLRWRDAAILAGWNPAEEQPSPKFEGLAAIEKHFSATGTADRWKALTDYLSGLSSLSLDCDIAVHCDAAAVEPYVRRVLDLLASLGVNIQYTPVSSASGAEGTALRKVQDELLNPSSGEKEKVSLPNDGSIEIVHFTDVSDAQQWAATVLPDEEETLLVNASNNAVADILYASGFPTVSASVSIDSTAASLVRMGLSLFRSPVDVNNLLAYLRLPVNPVGSVCVEKKNKAGESYYVALNKVLADSLLSTGGLSEWKDIIESAAFDHEGNPIKPGIKEALLGRLYMWEKSSGDKVRKGDVLAYLSNLGTWSAPLAHLLDDPSWSLIREFNNAFEMLMENESEWIPLNKLLNWSDGLTFESGLSVHSAEVGSIPAIGNIRSLFDSPKDVVWLDCVGIDSVPYAYDFLSPSERRFFAGGYLTKEEASQIAHKAIIDAVARISGTLALVTYDTDHGALCAENPFITELRTRFDIPVSEGHIPDELMEKGELGGYFSRGTEFHITPELLEGRKRECESYSSLSELFQSPFDYVLDYLLKYGTYGETTIINVDAVKGTVAHKYIEDLINDCNKDIAAMRAMHDKQFESRILATTSDVGVVMLSNENRLEYAKFKSVLRKSVVCLLEFLEGNGFSIVGTEYEVTTELPVIGKFFAKIDLLLKNAGGEYAIVDFKWSSSSYYVRALENQRHLQLALYKAAVEAKLGAPVITTGYFILPKYHFYTVQDSGLSIYSHIKVIELEEPHDLYEQARNSYAYRMKQLKAGIIEEGESFVLDDIQYARDTESLNLYPLEEEYGNEGVKAINNWNKNIILKGGLEDEER